MEAGKVVAARPASGFYFESLDHPLEGAESVAQIEKRAEVFQRLDCPFFWDRDFEDMARTAKELYHKSDYLIFGNVPCHIFVVGCFRGGLRPSCRPARASGHRRVRYGEIGRDLGGALDRYAATVGPYVQIIFLYSDGSISPLIADLIEIEIDILNPPQYTTHDMHPGQLESRFGWALVFSGAVRHAPYPASGYPGPGQGSGSPSH